MVTLIEQDTFIDWTPKMIRDELLASNWRLKSGVWCVPVNSYPPCFKDTIVEKYPDWIAYWFIEASERTANY